MFISIAIALCIMALVLASRSSTTLIWAKANGTYMKAPNGAPSRLTEQQWAQVRTKAFKAWFGDWDFVKATDEYLGELSEKGFEDFSDGERSLWQKLKAAVLKAIDSFLSSIKLPSWVILGDNELRYMLWKSAKRMEEKNLSPIKHAEKTAKEYELNLDDKTKRKEQVTIKNIKDVVLSEFKTSTIGKAEGRLIPIGSLTKEGRDYLESISGIQIKKDVRFILNASELRHIYLDHYESNEKDTGNNIPLNDEDIRSMVDVIMSPDKVVYAVEDKTTRKLFYFLKDSNNGTYNLAEVYADKKGNLTAKTFYKTKKGSNQRANDLFNDPKLSTSKTDGASPNSSAKIPRIFEIAKNKSKDTAVYREIQPLETDDIWKDNSVGMNERLTAAAVKLSENHREDYKLRDLVTIIANENLK